MIPSIKDRRVSDHLDFFRGTAALAVLIYHIRYRFFFDYGDLTDPAPLVSCFYALTSFGHDAVMIFFVLSGYLIAGSVIRDRNRNGWSWRRYLTNRLVRLHVVLLPGLLLGLFWDRLGLLLYPGHPIYTGEKQAWTHDFFSVAARMGIGPFLRNVFFLQTIEGPPFGSNEPLWSLSFEFWFYLLFPCLWIALVRPRRWTSTLIHLSLFGVIAWFVGGGIRMYFPIWLMGAAVGLIPQVGPLKRRFPQAVVIGATGIFGGLVIATHAGKFKALTHSSVFVSDSIIAAGFALLLYLLLHDLSPKFDDRYARLSRFIASFSFTLYVSHMPLLVFLRATLVPGLPWTFDLAHLGVSVLLAAICLAYAIAVAHVTEAKTESVRSFVSRLGLPSKFHSLEKRTDWSPSERPNARENLSGTEVHPLRTPLELGGAPH